MLRFPHLAKQILQKLDDEGMAKIREVEHLWQKFIDERDYSWLRIVNIPTVLANGNTYLHLAAEHGQIDAFKVILDEDDNKDPKTDRGETPFLLACWKGRMNIASILMKKSGELKIDLNQSDNGGLTSFHLACIEGHSEIAEIMINSSAKLKIDFSNDCDRTGFHLACYHGHLKLAKMVLKNSQRLKMDLNKKDNCGLTGFHLAILEGHSSIAEMIINKSSGSKIDLNTNTNTGFTVFHLACVGRPSDKRSRIVEMILEFSESHKIDLTAKDKKHGRTGYQLAEFFKNTEVINLIKTKMPSLVVV